MINIQKLNKYFNKSKQNEIHVINDTSLSLPSSGLVALLGPSGSGKTTLLNTIGGLDKVDNGRIEIDGTNITSINANKLDEFRNAHIGYIFQNFNLLDDKTVWDNVALALRMIGFKDENAISDRVTYCLEKLGIYRFRKKLARELSGGQRQRVAIARAIVKNPDIVIADEPTGNLDNANTVEIMNIIKNISKEKLVVLVTHEQKIAKFYADYIYELDSGSIVKSYQNESSENLDYQFENHIYLQDLPHIDEGKVGFSQVKIYSDQDAEVPIKLVIKGDNIFIDTGGKYNAVTETNITLIDDHYKASDASIIEENDFDYNEKFPQGFLPHYTSVFKLGRMLRDGFASIRSFKLLKKLLLLGFFPLAIIMFVTVSGMGGVTDIDSSDYISTNQKCITVKNPTKSKEVLSQVANLEGMLFAMPGDTKVSVTLPLEDYIQTQDAECNINVAICDIRAIKDEKLLAGAMPKADNEVVLDKMSLKFFFKTNQGKVINVTEASELVGRSLKAGELPAYTIVGISDTESPSLYVNSSEMDKFLLNSSDPMDNEELMYGFAFDGGGFGFDDETQESVRDVQYATGDFKIVKGSYPSNVGDVVVNQEMYADDPDYEIGSSISGKLKGQKLKIVGYYKSLYEYDETLYVNRETLMDSYIKSKKIITCYAENPDAALRTLEEAGLKAEINKDRDKKAYLKQIKDTVKSSLITFVILGAIAFALMYFILRSSFLSRVGEIGTLRAIGLKRSDICKMFMGEIIDITLLTAIPGIIITYYIMFNETGASETTGKIFMVNPGVAIVTLLLMLLFNLLAGLLPLFRILRKSPAEILARNDI